MSPAFSSFLATLAGVLAATLVISIRLGFHWAGAGEIGALAFYICLMMIPIYLCIILPLSYCNWLFVGDRNIIVIRNGIIGFIAALIAMVLVSGNIAQDPVFLLSVVVCGLTIGGVTTILRKPGSDTGRK